ncbi:unnamed protein product [Onchocerca flexuosa]|uniref:Calponin-homology (CH) domain-containing protein n=1 Tax=Onchocerca flexuosa TaxID=387005 RepID=A0A183H889_9BILA|nr:unnamed protein product [Onchocerca flexuosa]
MSGKQEGQNIGLLSKGRAMTPVNKNPFGGKKG